MRSLALSICSSNKSHRATNSAPGVLTTKLASRVPRPPAPIKPTRTAELAAVPRTAASGNTVAACTRFRLVRVESILLICPNFCRKCIIRY